MFSSKSQRKMGNKNSLNLLNDLDNFCMFVSFSRKHPLLNSFVNMMKEMFSLLVHDLRTIDENNPNLVSILPREAAAIPNDVSNPFINDAIIQFISEPI